MRTVFGVLLAVMAGACDDGSDRTGQTDLGGGGGAMSDSGQAGAGGEAGAGGQGCYLLADGRCVEETFANPPVLAPNADGVYELELMPTEIEVKGKRHCARAYNGMYPAPTIDTGPMTDGPRQVRVNLRNRFTRADYESLNGDVCTCEDAGTGMSCEPGHHGGDCACTNEKGEMCHVFDFNLTNLHAHGSHVRPDYATGGGCVEGGGLRCRSCNGDRAEGPRECFFADDVISKVPAGEGVQHRWDIDEDGEHHEGMFWYHPHIHGSTAIQVASGATGAWIVRGAMDDMPGIKDARERILVFTTPPVGFSELAEGEPCDEDHITFNDFTVLGDTSEKQVNLINGQRQPRMIMAPGQIERWRWLHGAFLDEVSVAAFRGLDSDCENLDFDAGPVPLTQIARDGLALPRPASGVDWPFAPPYFFMSPGYRIDMMLDGSDLAHGDTLCLMAGRFLQTDETGMTDEPVGFLQPPTLDDILQKVTNGDLIGIVNVTDSAGPPTETEMPDLRAVAARAPSTMLQGGAVDALARCEAAQAIEDVDEVEQLAFFWAIPLNQEGFDMCACPDHNVNCENFELTDRERYPFDRVLTKGAVEHWRLMAGFDGHPFHIHINPFLVCPLPPEGADHRNTKGRLFEPPFAHWRDTYLVNLDRVADVVTEYKNHTGAFVFHCHKLNHEDHGMMELIQICDPETDDCGTQCSGGECSWRSCAEGDNECERAVRATECLADLSKCPEAALRCAACGDEGQCPGNARCADEADRDGILRCIPGCLEDDDCPPTDACVAGECAPAPCGPPCRPGQRCEHGVCQ